MDIREVFIRIRNQEKNLPAHHQWLWARPKWWKDSGRAVCVRSDSHTLLCVPDHRGGTAYIPTLRDLLDDWEIITSTEVCEEIR